MPLQRLPDWQSRLFVYLQQSAAVPFEYGIFDCCRFVAGAIHAQTGNLLGEYFSGRYRSRREAFQIIKEYCGASDIRLFADRLARENDMPSIATAFAGRGDVVLIGDGPDAALGIVALHGYEFIGLKKEGLWRGSMAAATRAWRVG